MEGQDSVPGPMTDAKVAKEMAKPVPQKPSVGRIVHYYPKSDDLREKRAQPFAAMVTHVWSDDCVNLSVFDDGSFPCPIGEAVPTSVNRHTDEQSAPTPGTWMWPPRV